MRARTSFVLLCVLFVGGCVLAYPLSGYTDGTELPAAIEGGLDAPVERDAPDAVVVDGGASPTVLAPNVGVVFPAGAAQQRHVHYAMNARLWVLFYLDDTDLTHLRTRTSADFSTWTEGSSLSLSGSHARDGRSFDVAYADLGGQDVFHVSLSTKPDVADRRHGHVRAVVRGGGVVFDAYTELGRVTLDEPNLDPDGPSTTVLVGGKVLETAGWYSADGGMERTGNVMGWVSTQGDDGKSWTPAFGPAVEVEVVKTLCNARTLVTTPSGALGIWEDATFDPRPTGLHFSRFVGSAWSGPQPLGFAATAFDVNDWGAAVASDASVHVVRYAGSFEHRFFDGSAWRAGQVLAALPHTASQGVVVVATSTGPTTLTLAASGAVVASTLGVDGWSSWREVVPGGPNRSWLSGNAGAGGIALLWTETSGGRRDLVGVYFK